MKTIVKLMGIALAIGVCTTAMTGCERKEGPAEKAGKAIDQGLDKAGQKIENAGESVQNAAEGSK
ncbi:hypothetical protein [Halothiobacillus neapolitanus]|jgi:hypothetical protein|uniref:Entericidin EcnAB n=1 Tax=Halothiobacillus neapolitanus (strain ATCC 23641 / DSM 15147 / CIP 104769 / NCIMB 8539 / c2) TaxID=555778 RepID=D0L0N4_HALNC|nr:hypothetical protein [Halothiobacillus neapolitanus]ACX96257.1 conserved hypothetical protein [Halothiobacillus neapolitanus c2]TDN66567.1 hypothetical protein C8D83_101905 [Halothiobacillus neapolitanus]